MPWLWVALAGTLLDGPLWPAAVISWIVVAVRTYRKTEEGICAAFFFAAFFHRMQWFPELLFSMKHFQLMILWLAVCLTVQGRLSGLLRGGLRRGSSLWPVLLLLGVTVLAAFLNGFAAGIAIKRSLNWLLVILCIYFLAMLFPFSKASLRTAVAYFLFGVVVQIGVNFYNLFFHTFFLGLDLLYNNQFATLLAISFFYALYFSLTAETFKSRFLAWSAFCIVTTALIFSLSRTAWLGCLLALILFTVMILFSRSGRFEPMRGKVLRAFVLSLAVAGFLLGSIVTVNRFVPVDESLKAYQDNRQGDEIVRRVQHTFQVFNPDYWRGTSEYDSPFEDPHNFGLFGVKRLQTLRRTDQIVAARPWTGVGLVPEVTDFHGFYFIVLAASGYPGLGLFLVFTALIYFRLAAAMQVIKQKGTAEESLFALCVFLSLFVWYLSAITQSMFLHFSVWLNVLIGMLVTNEALKKI